MDEKKSIEQIAVTSKPTINIFRLTYEYATVHFGDKDNIITYVSYEPINRPVGFKCECRVTVTSDDVTADILYISFNYTDGTVDKRLYNKIHCTDLKPLKD